jgi:hypothetical protein
VQIAQGSQQRIDATHAQHVVGISKQDHIHLQMQPNGKINKLEKNAIALKKLGIGKKNMFTNKLKKMKPIVKKPKSKLENKCCNSNKTKVQELESTSKNKIATILKKPRTKIHL